VERRAPVLIIFISEGIINIYKSQREAYILTHISLNMKVQMYLSLGKMKACLAERLRHNINMGRPLIKQNINLT
jgi:hypothetical protein